MLLELTDSLIGYSPEESESVKHSVFNLLNGFYEGTLYLMASPTFCDFFKRVLSDPISQSALHYLDINSAVVPNVRYKLKVVLKSPDSSKNEVDYLFFSKSLSTQAPFFLCESFNDISFYKKLVYFYYPRASICSFDISGGGESIGEMFSRIQKKQCFCLTIVDSDMRFPGAPLGKTAKKCKEKYINKPPVGLYILKCHEVENLVPLDFLMNHSAHGGNSFLKRIRATKNECDLRYYDFKNGIIKKDVEESSKLFLYFQKLFGKLYRKNIDSYLKSKAPDDEILPRIRKDCLTCYLDNTPKYLSSDYMDNDRKEIADIVFSFLCCRGQDPML